MKLKDLVERVAASTGARKSEAKASVEATLAVLAEALEAGTELAVPPLGKLRVTRRSGPVLVLKLRRKGEAGDDAKAGAKPLAEDGEDD